MNSFIAQEIFSRMFNLQTFFAIHVKSQPAFTCSKLTINTPERQQWRRFDVFIVNF